MQNRRRPDRIIRPIDKSNLNFSRGRGNAFCSEGVRRSGLESNPQIRFIGDNGEITVDGTDFAAVKKFRHEESLHYHVCVPISGDSRSNGHYGRWRNLPRVRVDPHVLPCCIRHVPVL